MTRPSRRRVWKPLLIVAGCVVALVLVLFGAAVVNTRVRSRSGPAWTHPPFKIAIHFYDRASPGRQTHWRVVVEPWRAGGSVDAVAVRGRLMNNEGEVFWEETVKTSTEGVAHFETMVPPELVGGRNFLAASVGEDDEEVELKKSIDVRERVNIVLDSDRQIYRPGEVIRVKVTARDAFDFHPMAGREIEVSANYFNEAVAFSSQKKKTGNDGSFRLEIPVPEDARRGDISLGGSAGGGGGHHHVTVVEGKPADHRIVIVPDGGGYNPGDTIGCEVRVADASGRRVVGDWVTLEASERERIVFKRRVRTGDEGIASFSIPISEKILERGATRNLPMKYQREFISIAVFLSDEEGNVHEASSSVLVSRNPIKANWFSIDGSLGKDEQNTVFVLTHYPDGSPAEAKVKASDIAEFKTTRLGFGKVELVPEQLELVVDYELEGIHGTRSSGRDKLQVEDRETDPLAIKAPTLVTDRYVYGEGDSVDLAISGADPDKGLVYIDVVREGQPLSMTSRAAPSGGAELRVELPMEVYGIVVIHVYQVSDRRYDLGDRRRILVYPDVRGHADEAVLEKARLVTREILPAMTRNWYSPLREDGPLPYSEAMSMGRLEGDLLVLAELALGWESSASRVRLESTR